MAVKEIVQEGAAILRQKAVSVKPNEFGTPALAALITDMRDTLEAEGDGVGLAAPQIGISKRLFIVSKRVFADAKQHANADTNAKRKPQPPARVFINPVIEKLSKKVSVLEEGCLSVRSVFGHIARADKTRIRALDEHGTPFVYNASGLLAEIFQHEVDHINGTLYIDLARDTYRLPPPADHADQ